MSYEEKIRKAVREEKPLPDKVSIPILQYFWQASPLAVRKKDAIPIFLSEVSVLKTFTNNERRILAKFMHVRQFSSNEIIFREGEEGVGFYFVLSGRVDILVKRLDVVSYENDVVIDVNKEVDVDNYVNVATLDKYDYFGELAILEDHSRRNATAISKDNARLIGIFKPDVEELIELYPNIAAKLLQAIAIIVSNRLRLVTNEVKALKTKILKMESNGAGR